MVMMMSKNRFEFYSDEDLIGVLDIVTGRTFNSFEIVDKLNKLDKENEQLKQEVFVYKKAFQQQAQRCRL